MLKRYCGEHAAFYSCDAAVLAFFFLFLLLPCTKCEHDLLENGHVLWTDMLKDIHSPGLVADPEDGGGGGGGGNGARCAGCGRSIDDRFYLSAVDMCWHIGCLQCAECKLPLDTELTCYSRHGNIYCKQDYYRLFSIKRCARCQGGIGACDLVMRAKDLVYHVECFACYACGAVLCKGDYYGVRDGAVFCRPDYERLKHRDMCELEPMCSPPRAASHHWPSAHKGRPRKKRNVVQLSAMTPSAATAATNAAECDGLTELNVLRIPAQSTLEVMQATDLSSSMESLTYETSSLSSPTNSSTMGTGTGTGGMSQHQHHHQQQQQQTRTKRMRTSFKHHQLRTMKSYFNINQNPDAKDLKQLAQKTGLSKRVLQVWFQNARAKWRRNIMRQENSQMVTSSLSNQNQNTPSDPDLIRGHTQSTQGLNFVDLF